MLESRHGRWIRFSRGSGIIPSVDRLPYRKTKQTQAGIIAFRYPPTKAGGFPPTGRASRGKFQGSLRFAITQTGRES